MYSRTQYMAGECTFDEYYLQFSSIFYDVLMAKFTPAHLAEKYQEDEYLNNIRLSYWDNLAYIYKSAIASKNFQLGNGRVWSISDGVCAAKATAREIARRYLAGDLI